jgi:hypothetical protein
VAAGAAWKCVASCRRRSASPDRHHLFTSGYHDTGDPAKTLAA